MSPSNADTDAWVDPEGAGRTILAAAPELPVRLLDGVSMPTASVLLHLAHKDPYPIIDSRALWSLGIEKPPATCSFEFWQEYTRTCRSLAKQAPVSMRTLDRALWQYSEEQQPPTRQPAPARARQP
jgi:hypothetical protein